MMEPIRLGVDNGNYNTKSSDRILYASGFSVQDTEFIVLDTQLQYAGKYYAIGERRMSFLQDKTKTDDVLILALPMLANAMRLAHTQEAEFLLGVGLPIAQFGLQKAAFREYFLRGALAFEYEETPYTAIIKDCQVFPQGYAALCNCYDQVKGFQTVTIVDIGGYTVDVMTVTDDKPLKSSCLSLRKGTILLFNQIRSTLQQRNITLPDTLISAAIRGESQHREKDTILIVTRELVQAYIKDLLNTLRECGLDLQLPVAFAGGGAELLAQELKAADVNVVAIMDRFANAQGYRMLMRV